MSHSDQNPTRTNLVICVSGIGVTKDFSCIITDLIPDLELIGKSQCFPLYYYTEATPPAQPSLFGEADGRDSMERHSALSPWAVAEARERYGAGVTDEDVFFMVYGALHSPAWRARFADDLRKALPRREWPGSRERFRSLAEAGRRLARLHLLSETDAELNAELEAELSRAGVK
ncbi:MAG: type ISP restriction/modification enzyme, partial [Bacteroidales bacterium]|nr:type ISP restriction/modification enzyme [Bacteroidales bacterium]